MLEPATNLPQASRISEPGQSLSMATVVFSSVEYSDPPAEGALLKNAGRTVETITSEGAAVLYTVICLYRNDPKSEFTRQEQKDAAVLGPHLTEAWLIKLFVHLQNNQAPFKAVGETALCDLQGTLWCARPQFAELLREEWPQWQDRILPKELSKTINIGGGSIVYDGKYLRCTASPGPTADFFYLHIQKQPPLLSLPPRQRRIAIELAQGKTYNQIAHNLGISRSTVTNHANAIYSKLGISNKVQLALLCFGHTLQSLIM